MKTITIIAVILFLLGHVMAQAQAQTQETKIPLSSFTLTSTVFKEGDKIPPQYSCDGENLSPVLTWAKAPTTTQSFALVVKDPDAPGGTFIHWVIYNIPSTKKRLLPSHSTKEKQPDGSLQGLNDFGKAGYGGPCPPRGSNHRYFFTLYALDAKLPERSGNSAADLETAMQGHILAQAQLMGTYRRSR